MRAHAVLLGSAAVLVALAAGPGLWGPADPAAWVGSWQKALFASVCHQDPHRSIWLNGAPMAVCDRCFGIYAGLGIGLLLAFAVRPPTRALTIAAVAAAALILLDAGGTMGGTWPPIRSVRVASGLLLGCAGGFLLVSSRTTSSSTSPSSTPS